MFSTLTCQKEELNYYMGALRDCMTESKKNMPPETGREYVSCRINGKKLLISDGFDNYQQYNVLGSTFVTSGPILSPDDSVFQYIIKIGFRQPGKPGASWDKDSDQFFLMLNTKNNLSPVEYIDQYIKVGDLKLKKYLNWETNDPELLDGIEMSYWCTCDCSQNGYDKGSTIGFTSIYREQNGFLRCTDKQRTDLGDKVFYHLEFEFEYECHIKEDVIKFTDGKMVVEFEMEK